MRRPILSCLLLATPALAACAADPPAELRPTTALRFEIGVAPQLLDAPAAGRLFVIASRSGDPEPRLTVGTTGLDAPPVFARDVRALSRGTTAVIDERAVAFPISGLAHLPAGEYYLQALFDRNIDLRSVNAPGNLFSAVERVRLDPARGGAVRLELNAAVPDEELPPDTDDLRFVRIQSEVLSRFHGRPIFLRAGVILPADYEREQGRRYPLRVRIGGYGTPYTTVQRMMAEDAPFRRAWLAADAPRMLLLHLDGDGPFGDPYQIDSATNGPYGEAVIRELIPYVERTFRAIGQPRARVLDGGSTGGWVALALQIFYPDVFNGAWSYCPDAVDFRAFQLVDIYEDENAFVNRHGFERPSARDRSGDVRFTMRHEMQMENVMGAGDSWAMSGGQWGAWNAAYGARGADGRPRPLWDPVTGAIDRQAARHWEQYDLRLVLERNWPTLGPKLRGRLNIWIGEADDYFLNNAVYLLEAFLSTADPPFEGRIVYGSRQGHCWREPTDAEVLAQMARQMEGGPLRDTR